MEKQKSINEIMGTKPNQKVNTSIKNIMDYGSAIQKQQQEQSSTTSDANWWQKLLNTGSQFMDQVQYGALKGIENIVDIVATWGGGLSTKALDIVNKVVDNKYLDMASTNIKNSIEDFVAKDFTDAFMNSDFKKYTSIQGLHDALGNIGSSNNAKSHSSQTSNTEERLENSFVNDITNNTLKNIIVGAEQGIGQLASQIAIGQITGSIFPYLFFSASGSASEQAIQDGFDFDKAIAYGVVSGATELAIERVSGGITDSMMGAKGLINPSKVVEKLLGEASTNKVLKAALSIIGDGFGEGLEEVVSTATDKFYDEYILNEKNVNLFTDGFGYLGTKEGFEEGLSAFLSAFISSAVFSTGGMVSNFKEYATNESINDYNDALINKRLEQLEIESTYDKDSDEYNKQIEKLNTKYDEKLNTYKSEVEKYYSKLNESQRANFDNNSYLNDFDFENKKINETSLNDYISQSEIKYNIKTNTAKQQEKLNNFKTKNASDLNAIEKTLVRAKKSGTKMPKIVFVDNLGKGINARYKEHFDTIEISTKYDVRKTLKSIVAHELMHSVYTNKKTAELFKKAFKNSFDYNQYKQRVENLNYNQKYVEEETYALMFEEKMGNTEFLDRLFSEEPSAFKSMLKKLKLFAKSFTKSSDFNLQDYVDMFEQTLKSDERLNRIFNKNKDTIATFKKLYKNFDSLTTPEKFALLNKMTMDEQNKTLIVLGSEDFDFKDVTNLMDSFGIMYSKEELLNRDTEFNKQIGDGLNGIERVVKYCEERGFSKKEINTFQERLLSTIDVLTKYATENGFKTLDEYLNKRAVINYVNGHLVLQALVSNGDYVVNFDLSATCKKKVVYQDVIETIAKEHLFDFKNNLSVETIQKIQDTIRDYGFEVPCTMCFVESRRLFQFSWAYKAANLWNESVIEVFTKYGEDLNDLDYYHAETLATNEDSSVIDEILKANKSDTIQSVDTNEKGNRKYGGSNAKTKVKNIVEHLYKANPNSLKLMDSGDLLTGDGLVGIKKISEEFFSFLQSSYGAGTPKMNRGFVAYTNELLRLTNDMAKQITGKTIANYDKTLKAMRKNYKGELKGAEKETYLQDAALRKILFDIGGARFQSFSDFRVEQVLDVLEFFTDLAIRKFPSESYTKEWAFIQLFGLTGNKANMSLISVLRNETNTPYLAGLREIKNESEATKGILIRLLADSDGNVILKNAEPKFDKKGKVISEYDEKGRLIDESEIVHQKKVNGSLKWFNTREEKVERVTPVLAPIELDEDSTNQIKLYTTDFITNAEDMSPTFKNLGKKTKHGYRDRNGLPIQSFPFDKACLIYDDPKYFEYSKNCGTIAIGFSDAHIFAMLDNDHISMVIPYHRSGMIKGYAEEYFFDNTFDYTKEQETKVSGENIIVRQNGKIVYQTDSNGKLIINKLPKGKITDIKKKAVSDLGFSYNAELQKAYNENMTKKEKNIIPKKVAEDYCNKCRAGITNKTLVFGKGANKTKYEVTCTYVPKFNTFSTHENYYKLLTDFTLYDAKHNYAPQTINTCKLPDNFNELLLGTKNHSGMLDNALEVDKAYEKVKPALMMDIANILAANVSSIETDVDNMEDNSENDEEGTRLSKSEQTSEQSSADSDFDFSNEDYLQVKVTPSTINDALKNSGLYFLDENLQATKLRASLVTLIESAKGQDKKNYESLLKLVDKEIHNKNQDTGKMLFDWANDHNNLLKTIDIKDGKIQYLNDFVKFLEHLNLVKSHDIQAALKASNYISKVNTQVSNFQKNVVGRQYNEIFQPMIDLLLNIQTRENFRKGMNTSKGANNVWFKKMDKIRETVELFVDKYFNASATNSPFYETFKNELQQAKEYEKELENIKEGDFVKEPETPFLNLYNELVLLSKGFYVGENHGQVTAGNQIMHMEEAKVLSNLFKLVNTTIDNYQKVIKYGKKIDIAEIMLDHVDTIKERYDTRNKSKIVDAFHKYETITSKAENVAKLFDGTIGDEKGFVGQIVSELDEAITNKNKMVYDLTKDYNDFVKANKKEFLNMSKETVDIYDEQGQKFTINMQEAVYLFYLCKRDQALSHFNIDYNKNAEGIKIVDDKGVEIGTYIGSDESIEAINDIFLDENGEFKNNFYKEYTQKIEYILKETQKKIQEIQMLLYGLTNAIDPNYIPIFNDHYNRQHDIAKVDNYGDLLYNLGMLKDVVAGAKSKINLKEIDYVIGNLVNKVSNYCSAYITMQNINMMKNYIIDGKSVQERLDGVLGNRAFEKWITNLCNHLFQINFTEDMEGLLDKVRSLSVTSTFALNVKVWVSQLTSYPAALTDLSPSDLAYGLKGITVLQTLIKKKGSINKYTLEYEKYAPKTFVRTYNAEVIKAEGNINKIGSFCEFLTSPISINDATTIYMIWNACQNKIARTTDYAIGTEENKKLAGELLDKVVSKTQPMYNPIDRPTIKNTNSRVIQYLTMFKTVAYQYFNVLLGDKISQDNYGVRLKQVKDGKTNAFGDTTESLEAKHKKLTSKTARDFTAITTANLSYALIVAMFSMLLGKKDEDEEVGEYILDNSISSLVSILPISSMVYNSIKSGYSFGYDPLDNVSSALTSLSSFITSPSKQSFFKLLKYSCSMLGIPFKNASEYLYPILNLFSPALAYKYKNLFYNQSTATDKKIIETAISKNNDSLGVSAISNYARKKGSTNISNSTLTSIYNDIVKNDTESITIVGVTNYDGDDEIKLADGSTITPSKSLNSLLQSTYASQVNAIVSNSYYKKLTSEYKTKAIKSLSTTIRVSTALGSNQVSTNKLANAVKYFGFNASTLISICYYLKQVKSGLTSDKKETILSMINKLSLTSKQKLVLKNLLGYALTESEQKQVLSGISLTKSNKELLLKYL